MWTYRRSPSQRRERGSPFHEFSSFDGGRAPFPDGSFDLVFSYHVLEHVADVEASVAEIGRLVRPGGHACIIFPCGNRGSFEERIIRMMKGGKEPTADGGTVFFYETGDGHLRRMTTDQTAVLFKGNGFSLVCAWHSGQFLGAVDWLCRASGPGYIRNVFFGRAPVSRRAGVVIRAAAAVFLGVNWIVRKRVWICRRKGVCQSRRPLSRLGTALALSTGLSLCYRSLSGAFAGDGLTDLPSIWCSRRCEPSRRLEARTSGSKRHHLHLQPCGEP